MVKKILILLVLLLGTLGCLSEKTEEGVAKELKNGSVRLKRTVSNNVELVKGELIVTNEPWGEHNWNSTHVTMDVYIKVNNLAYNKEVSVFYGSGANWKTSDASYYKTLDNGDEIWKSSCEVWTDYVTPGHVNPLSYSTNFAIKYKVNGTEYWDNNNGANYYMAIGMGNGPSIVTNKEILLEKSSLVPTGSLYTFEITFFKVDLIVKNISYDKDIKVIYTTNNWESQGAVIGIYSGDLENGYEKWKASGGMWDGAHELEYYISYEVNGVTYYDNNFGENYSVKLEEEK